MFGHFDGDPVERVSSGNFVRWIYHHPDPRIALVCDPQATLMINLTLENYDGDETKLSAAVRYLSWFLPRTYNIAPMPAGWSDSTFVPLGNN